MDQVKSLLEQVLGPQGAGDTNGQGQGSSARGLDHLLNGRGDLAKGLAAGGLAGLLLGNKKGRKVAGNAMKVGGLALVGGLAYKAWRDHRADQEGAPTPEAQPTPATREKFLPSTPGTADTLNRKLIRAMIAAAKADGHIDETERARIESQLEVLALGPDDRAFVQAELGSPLSIDTIASDVSCHEEAAEIYAASLLVVDPTGAAEKGYLAMLAARLELDPLFVERLHRETEKLAAG